MKTHTKQAIKYLPLIDIGLSITLLIVTFFIKDIPKDSSYFYQNNTIIESSWHNTFDLITAGLFLIILIISIILTIICIVQKIKNKEKIKKYILLIWTSEMICFLIILFSNVLVIGIWSDNDYSPDYYKYTDGRHMIVIREESFLLYGGGTIYQIKENNEAIILENFTTDDGGRNKGKYEIKWYDDYAEITYDIFNNSQNSERTVKITFV